VEGPNVAENPKAVANESRAESAIKLGWMVLLFQSWDRQLDCREIYD